MKRTAAKRVARTKPKAKPKSTVTAMVRAKKATVLSIAAPAPTDIHVHAALTQGGTVGMVGLIPIKLSSEEIRVLSEPVNVEDIRIKPTGQAYLSHPTYTRWLNRAFGMGQWALVPQSSPTVDKVGRRSQVLVLYVLYIRGQAAGSAYGEQEYFEDSSEQSRGDAVEASYASGLRRNCKHIGMALEMWDRPYLDRFIKEACIKVKVRSTRWDRAAGCKVDKLVFWWRRRVDVAFPGEIGQVSESEMADDDSQRRGGYVENFEPGAGAKSTPAPAQPRDGRLITEPQMRRLHAIAHNAGRSGEVVKAWLKAKYNIDSSKQIKWKDYDEIITAIESEGALPQ